MVDAYHDVSAVEAAVALANTWMPIRGKDALETVEQLGDFLAEHPVGRDRSGAGPTEADLAEVRALRETVRAVLERADTDPAGAATLINDGLRQARATPTLRHDGDDRWRIEVDSDGDRPAARLAATTLTALAGVIAALGPGRLGVCAGPTCRATYVDLSRNGSKQYCTRTCAHRASVAAYRSRTSER
jgi:predicted RNA-binding Zn ribbon-like protein